MSRGDVVKVFWRLPADVKAWIEREAARDERTQNAVAVRALRAMMASEREGAAR